MVRKSMPPETSPTVTRGHDERYVLPRTYPWSQLRFFVVWGNWFVLGGLDWMEMATTCKQKSQLFHRNLAAKWNIYTAIFVLIKTINIIQEPSVVTLWHRGFHPRKRGCLENRTKWLPNLHNFGGRRVNNTQACGVKLSFHKQKSSFHFSSSKLLRCFECLPSMAKANSVWAVCRIFTMFQVENATTRTSMFDLNFEITRENSIFMGK